MLLIMSVIAVLGLAYMGAAQSRLEAIVDGHMSKIDLATHMRRAARERTVLLLRMALTPDSFAREDLWLEFTRHGSDFIDDRRRLQDMGLTPAESTLLELQGQLTQKAVPLQRRVVDLLREDRLDEARALLVNEAIPAQDRVLEALESLYFLQEDTARGAARQAADEYRRARVWTLGLTGCLLVMALMIAGVVIRRTGRLAAAVRRERDSAEVTLQSIGDAVIRVNGEGQIDYMNAVAERLSGWRNSDSRGRAFDEVFPVRRESQRNPAPPGVIELDTGAKQDDMVLTTHDGDEHGVEINVARMVDPVSGEQGSVIVVRDVTEVRALSREVTYQATHDVMTGLLNRLAFERQLQLELGSAHDSRSDSALCYIDLDMFKVVNDACGHLAGDELLRQLGGVLQGAVRHGDVVARIGGDEFAVVLRGCSIGDARNVADNVLDAIRSFRFVWEDKSFEIGASIGIVPVARDSGDLRDVLRAADVSCRVAKNAGRNRIHVMSPGDAALSEQQQEMDWVQRIRHAMDHDRFTLYGQPIEPTTPELGGAWQCEILLRMKDDAGGVVRPVVFLPAAERYRMMPLIDRWVIQATLRTLAPLDLRLLPENSCFNINLSGQSLGDTDFADFVLEAVEASSVPPGRICFEITETAAVMNLSSANTLISALRERGCRFALDDFGSGLSSFTYLKNMKVDFLKIDGAFVRTILDDRADLAMVRSIVQVAHTMGISTVAEFVESVEIRNRLRTLGVDLCQGYAVARPAPLKDVLRRYAEAPAPRPKRA